MGKSVGVRELRQNASAVLRRVKAGEIIDVTERGETVARLVPAQHLSRYQQMVADGEVQLASGSLIDSLREFPPLPPKPGVPLPSEILAQMREAEPW